MFNKFEGFGFEGDLDSFRMALNSHDYQRTALHAWAFIVIENAR